MELTEVQQIKQKIADLEEQLLAAQPNMPMLLREIHTTLLKDQNLVESLTDEEIGVIASGLQRQTQIAITTTVKKPATKKIANISVNDL